MEGSVSGYRTKFRSNLITIDHDVHANWGNGGISPYINLSNILRIMEAAVGLTQSSSVTYRSETERSRKIFLPEIELLVHGDGHNVSLLLRQRSENPRGI
jgi:hypothetical protein